MQRFVDKYGLDDMTMAIDKNTDNVWAHFGVLYRGSWVFVDDDGTVTKRVGHIPEKELVERLDSLAAS